MSAGSVVVAPTASGRPTRDMPLWQIVELSLYWLGINVVWGGMNVIQQPRVEDMLGVARAGTGIAVITIAGTIIAILVQPTLGIISDHTSSRWGRRKPYIAIGAALDIVFLIGVAYSNTFLGLVAFITLLQLSSNFAQGPFQGYLPDLVPKRQVGVASGLMGIMIMLGRVIGTAIGTIGLFTGDFVIATLGLGVIEALSALATLLTVDDGLPPTPRAGRSWTAVALSAWGLDLLRERSFVWLLASRLFVLMAPVILTDFAYFYMTRSLGLDDRGAGTWINVALPVFAAATLLTTYPAARLSDRLGRKALIYASCAIGAVGMAGVALAPTVVVTIAFAALVGISAGSFLAVDWALMTEIIPKAESGRYMGISNVASAAAGPIAVTFSGLTMDAVGQGDLAAGPRAAMALALIFYAIGALLLRPVVEPRD